MSERDKFMSRLSDARAVGLVDVKFFFQPEAAQAMKPEEVFRAMNEVHEAIKTAQRHSGWNGDNASGLSTHPTTD